MKQFVMLCGVPGSGKSSYCKKRIPNNFAIISEDLFLEQWATEENITYQESFNLYKEEAEEMMYRRLEQAIRDNEDIVWDQTNLTVEERAEKLLKVGNDYQKIAYCWELDLAILEEQLNGREKETGKHIPPTVVDEMRAAYERPSHTEGFDEVIVIASWKEQKRED